MNDSTIDKLLSDYARRTLSPTDAEQKYVSKKYNELDNFLAGVCFQSGSFARYTAIRPMHDLDVIWITNDELILTNPESFMQQLAADLEEQYREFGEAMPKISIQTHSVSLLFSDIGGGFSIDVVPAVPSTDPALTNDYGQPIYVVPEIIKKDHDQRQKFYESHKLPEDIKWVYTDPKGYIKRATDIDRLSKGAARKSAKFLKAWRHGLKEKHGDKFAFKAFHLEQINSIQFVANSNMSVYEALRANFNILSGYVKNAPCIEDAAYRHLAEEKYIDEYMGDPVKVSTSDKELILSEIMAASDLVSQLENAQTDVEVTKITEQLLGRQERQSSGGGGSRSYSKPTEPWFGG